MVLHAMEIGRDQSLCKYNGGSCPNRRAIRSLKHGLLRLCDYRQSRAREYQKRYLKRHKKQRRPPPATEAEPVTSPVPPAAAAAAAPFVVIVVASETNIAALPLQLASAGQQLSAVACQSNGQLLDLLRHASCGEAISAAVGSESALAMPMATALAHEQSETTRIDEHNPSLDLPCIDADGPSLLDDGEWFRDLLEVQDQS